MFEVIFGDLNSAWRQGLCVDQVQGEVEICSMKTSLFLIIINYMHFSWKKERKKRTLIARQQKNSVNIWVKFRLCCVRLGRFELIVRNIIYHENVLCNLVYLSSRDNRPFSVWFCCRITVFFCGKAISQSQSIMGFSCRHKATANIQINNIIDADIFFWYFLFNSLHKVMLCPLHFSWLLFWASMSSLF